MLRIVEREDQRLRQRYTRSPRHTSKSTSTPTCAPSRRSAAVAGAGSGGCSPRARTRCGSGPRS